MRRRRALAVRHGYCNAAVGGRSLALRVAIIADNTDTLDDLGPFLDRMGFPSCGIREIVAPVAGEVAAIVLFPDDFAAPAVAAFILDERRRFPRVLLVLVTRRPDVWQPQVAPDGVSVTPIVLPKPAFGTAIVDAIRTLGTPR